MYEIVERIGTRRSLPVWGEIINGPYKYFSQALEVLQSEPNHKAVVRDTKDQAVLTMTRDSSYMLAHKTKEFVNKLTIKEESKHYQRESHGIN